MRKHSELDWGKLCRLGRELVGKPYRFGAEIDLKDPDPSKINGLDCSELVEWLFAQIGLPFPDGSYNQSKFCKSVSMSNLLVGDLGFKWWPDTQMIHHVGIYIGNEEVLEAKGISWGIVITPKEQYMRTPHFARWGRHKDIEDA